MRQSSATSLAERTVRRCLAQIRRAILPDLGTPTVAAAMPQLMTAARRLAFLYLLEVSGNSSLAPGFLGQRLAAGIASGGDRFYSQVVAPCCAELLGAPELPVTPVPDAQFGAWLELFRSWNWMLIEGGGTDRATPELLGAICEFSLDQKAHGAYFTSPDVTAYVCANVLLPALLDRMGPPPGTTALSELLSGWELPGSVERYLPSPYREPGLLPLETEYERSARRAQAERCRRAWEAGQIRFLDDWITWNLDLGQLLHDWVRATTDRHALGRFCQALQEIRILDPTCGSGAFLIGALETLLPLHHALRERLAGLPAAEGALRIPGSDSGIAAGIVRRNLYGIDQAMEAVETCRMRLFTRIAACDAQGAVPENVQFNVRQADVLADEVYPEVVRAVGGFNAVVGNPPYVAYAAGGRYAAMEYRTESSENLYALVTERATQLLRRDGRLGMILPVSSTSLPSFRPLADLLRQGNAWISSYSNRPAKLFSGVEQRLSIWITGPSPSPTTYASAYQHWYAEERAQLFSRLTYVPASIWSATGMPVKSGCTVAEQVFRKLSAHRGRLGEYECSADKTAEAKASVWLHDGPTYWVRALTFPPNPEAPLVAGHYHRIIVGDPRSALVLAAVLSSTTFYFFFKMVSNCRDLGRKEWTAFPIDALPVELVDELERLGRGLQERLRETASLRSRRYPRGRAEYREYYPARAKETLDAIDRVLAWHYGFSNVEVDYLLSYDLKYRMGQNDAG